MQTFLAAIFGPEYVRKWAVYEHEYIDHSPSNRVSMSAFIVYRQEMQATRHEIGRHVDMLISDVHHFLDSHYRGGTRMQDSRPCMTQPKGNVYIHADVMCRHAGDVSYEEFKVHVPFIPLCQSCI